MLVRTVLTGCSVFANRDIGVFAFQLDGGKGKTVFNVLLGTQWHRYDTEAVWAAIGMAGAKYPNQADWAIVAASSEGDLWELTPGTTAEKVTRISGDYDGLTKLATLGDAIWACGMGRLVLRREADGTWKNVSGPEPAPDEGVIGFTALAGIDKEVTAVGWKGEIWVRTGGRWVAQDSGTEANLNAVSISTQGQGIAVGDEGTILIGRRNKWSVLDTQNDGNFQGVCHFGDEIFLCTDFTIYRLEKDRLIEETRFAQGEKPRTCMNLLPGKDTLFMQGEKDIFKFSQGTWSRVFSIGPGSSRKDQRR